MCFVSDADSFARGLTSLTLTVTFRAFHSRTALYLWSSGVWTLSSLVMVIALRCIWQRRHIYSIEHRLVAASTARASSATRVVLGR